MAARRCCSSREGTAAPSQWACSTRSSPGKAHGPVDATIAALLRAEHYAAQARLALLRMKPPPLGRVRLDEAIDPVRAIARGLTHRADRAALLAYIVAEMSAALPAPSPHREAAGDE